MVLVIITYGMQKDATSLNVFFLAIFENGILFCIVFAVKLFDTATFRVSV